MVVIKRFKTRGKQRKLAIKKAKKAKKGTMDRGKGKMVDKRLCMENRLPRSLDCSFRLGCGPSSSQEEEQCIQFSEIETAFSEIKTALEDIQLGFARTQKIVSDMETTWMNRLSVLDDRTKTCYSRMNALLDRITEKLHKKLS